MGAAPFFPPPDAFALICIASPFPMPPPERRIHGARTCSVDKGPSFGKALFSSGESAREKRRVRVHPKSHRTTYTAKIMAKTSAVRPAGTAWRVFFTFTAPKYTAMT